MSLSKSNCWYSNKCLRFLKGANVKEFRRDIEKAEIFLQKTYTLNCKVLLKILVQDGL